MTSTRSEKRPGPTQSWLARWSCSPRWGSVGRRERRGRAEASSKEGTGRWGSAGLLVEVGCSPSAHREHWCRWCPAHGRVTCLHRQSKNGPFCDRQLDTCLRVDIQVARSFSFNASIAEDHSVAHQCHHHRPRLPPIPHCFCGFLPPTH